MHTTKHYCRAIALLTLLLSGCSQVPLQRSPLPDALPLDPSQAMLPVPTEAAAASQSLATSQATRLDSYRVDFAQAVLQANPDKIFSGQLPPMLPAIVVVNIWIDAEGNLAKAVVQRSRDDEASTVALASLRRATPFPRPVRLLNGGGEMLEFSETFLFNRDYRFQLRTLAGPQ